MHSVQYVGRSRCAYLLLQRCGEATVVAQAIRAGISVCLCKYGYGGSASNSAVRYRSRLSRDRGPDPGAAKDGFSRHWRCLLPESANKPYQRGGASWIVLSHCIPRPGFTRVVYAGPIAMLQVRYLVWPRSESSYQKIGYCTYSACVYLIDRQVRYPPWRLITHCRS